MSRFLFWLLLLGFTACKPSSSPSPAADPPATEVPTQPAAVQTERPRPPAFFQPPPGFSDLALEAQGALLKSRQKEIERGLDGWVFLNRWVWEQSTRVQTPEARLKALYQAQDFLNGMDYGSLGALFQDQILQKHDFENLDIHQRLSLLKQLNQRDYAPNTLIWEKHMIAALLEHVLSGDAGTTPQQQAGEALTLANRYLPIWARGTDLFFVLHHQNRLTEGSPQQRLQTAQVVYLENTHVSPVLQDYLVEAAIAAVINHPDYTTWNKQALRDKLAPLDPKLGHIQEQVINLLWDPARQNTVPRSTKALNPRAWLAKQHGPKDTLAKLQSLLQLKRDQAVRVPLKHLRNELILQHCLQVRGAKNQLKAYLQAASVALQEDTLFTAYLIERALREDLFGGRNDARHVWAIQDLADRQLLRSGAFKRYRHFFLTRAIAVHCRDLPPTQQGRAMLEIHRRAQKTNAAFADFSDPALTLFTQTDPAYREKTPRERVNTLNQLHQQGLISTTTLAMHQAAEAYREWYSPEFEREFTPAMRLELFEEGHQKGDFPAATMRQIRLFLERAHPAK
ncbi:hypothetical protein [Acanthopleuribacter pedis]|uniref:Lipoprotein n=1 Tax=Acanthopleuribacter pedis TaxID=442870 RepID=A0A8J7Q5X8_9BACT|nr:hypothetical protein [Acanthopleuribacter pedis]MBO1318369.1 hypothetical protein [Acanthopleuribacter pedis]